MRILLPLFLTAASLAQSPPTLHWRANSLHQIYQPPPGIYCYAPSAIQDGPSFHLFACRNLIPCVIRDHLYYFSSPTTQPTLALAPDSPGTWDSFHVCDPCPLAGSFTFNHTLFHYALFFLGNNVDASKNNQIGVAFSNDLSGPWHRAPHPLIADHPDIWGTGQPSAISLDHAGKLLLFYTRSSPHTSGFVRQVDLSDADHPFLSPESPLPTAGLTRSDGRRDYLNNFDISLDPTRHQLLLLRERHPRPRTEPRFITESLQIASLPYADLFHASASWTVLANLTPDLTHLSRNHNAGFVRDPYGNLPDPHLLHILFSSSQSEPQLHGLFAPFSYTLYQIDADLID